jgi:hypothetical protein
MWDRRCPTELRCSRSALTLAAVAPAQMFGPFKTTVVVVEAAEHAAVTLVKDVFGIVLKFADAVDAVHKAQRTIAAAGMTLAIGTMAANVAFTGAKKLLRVDAPYEEYTGEKKSVRVNDETRTIKFVHKGKCGKNFNGTVSKAWPVEVAWADEKGQYPDKFKYILEAGETLVVPAEEESFVGDVWRVSYTRTTGYDPKASTKFFIVKKGRGAQVVKFDDRPQVN